jgi:hypothetical protein
VTAVRAAENSGRKEVPRFGRRPQSAAALRARRSYESIHVAAIAAAISLAFFRAFYAGGMILLYGDAVAHIHIARRVFDSMTPGPLQLGTVWLPLPHLLMIPFLVSDWMWRTGVGGSIVSMVAYVAGAIGIFRLVRGRTSRPGAWVAAAIYGLNPNLIYLQATAMTEPLYLALFIWAVVFLDEAVQPRAPEQIYRAARAVERAAMLIAAAMLTRYDGWWLAGWVLAAAFGAAVFMLLKRRRAALELFSGLQYRRLRIAVRDGVLLLAAVPVLWLAYNYGVFGNPLEFATGAYSARAIEQRTATTSPTHPGQQNLWVAGIYFQKLAKLNLGDGRWEWPLLAIAVAGLLLSLVAARRFAVWWLLWLPLPFYMLSIAYGSAPVFLPAWWPFSYYNVRYGLELLPAVAAFSAIGFETLRQADGGLRWRAAVSALILLAIAGSYLSVWRSTPICLREAMINSRTRVAFERALADWLRRLPPSARILMYTGAHPGALQLADIPGKRVVDEGNYPQWAPALHDPAAYVDYVVAVDGDPVAGAAARHQQELVPLAIVQSSGQPRTTIYKTLRLPPGERAR